MRSPIGAEPAPRSGEHPAAMLVDAHVHLHSDFPLEVAFSAAVRNFERAAIGSELGCLLLAEMPGQEAFRRLCEQPALGGGWSVHPTGEAASLLLAWDDRPRLVLIGGRQLVTRERLEVLVFGAGRPLEAKQSLGDTVREAESAGALAVVPWGFGKWWLERGALLTRLIEQSEPGRFFLGDNGGRPQPSPEPPLLRRAAQRGIWNLPGTDPLPLAWQVGRAGSFGFVLPRPPDLSRPFAQLKRFLLETDTQPRIFGRRSGWLRFARAQAELLRSR